MRQRNLRNSHSYSHGQLASSSSSSSSRSVELQERRSGGSGLTGGCPLQSSASEPAVGKRRPANAAAAARHPTKKTVRVDADDADDDADLDDLRVDVDWMSLGRRRRAAVDTAACGSYADRLRQQKQNQVGHAHQPRPTGLNPNVAKSSRLLVARPSFSSTLAASISHPRTDRTRCDRAIEPSCRWPRNAIGSAPFRTQPFIRSSNRSTTRPLSLSAS